jgi:hypothetical protein
MKLDRTRQVMPKIEQDMESITVHLKESRRKRIQAVLKYRTKQIECSKMFSSRTLALLNLLERQAKVSMLDAEIQRVSGESVAAKLEYERGQLLFDYSSSDGKG